MASIFRDATEYTRNAITLAQGASSADIVSVGVYHAVDPNDIPAPADFTVATLIDDPGDPLYQGEIDILALVGPRDGDVTLTPGVYQRYVLITTATEDIIRRTDTLEVL